ncbi:MAG: cell wall hydrolase [Oscillospiraceae bacterium]
MNFRKSVNLKKNILSSVMCLAFLISSALSLHTDILSASAETLSYTSDSMDSFTVDGYTEEDIDMLCAVVEREVGGLSATSKQLVTSVIINRINSSAFPNTVYDVLHQPNQFKTIKNYYTNERPVQISTRIAVLYTLQSGMDCADGAMYFYAPAVIDSEDKTNWFESNLEFVTEVDGQRYFR